MHTPIIAHAWDMPKQTEEDRLFVEWLASKGIGIKAGLTALTAYTPTGSVGRSVLKASRKAGGFTIHDGKFCDLRKQMVGAVENVVSTKVSGLTIRLNEEVNAGTLRAIRDARDRRYQSLLEREDPASKKSKEDQLERKLEKPILFGVIELSSSGASRVQFEERLLRYADAIANAGIDGIVVPGAFLETIKRRFPTLVTLVVGIRAKGERIDDDDQRYPITIAEAAHLKGDVLVIGRPIAQAPDRKKAALAFKYEIEHAIA